MPKQKSPQVQKDYFAYLLRMWREENGEEMPVGNMRLWRASLQSPNSHQRIGFTCLEELFTFLLSQAGISPFSDHEQSE
jgi:hypothetical protein